MTALSKNSGSYRSIGHDRQTEAESSRLLTKRSMLLFVLVMVLLPFLLARLYISRVAFLRSAEFTESVDELSPQGLGGQPQTPLLEDNKPSPLGELQAPLAEDNEPSPFGEPEAPLAEDNAPSPLGEPQTPLAEDKQPADMDLPSEEIDVKQLIDFSVGGCNIWRGQWVHHPSKPPYTNVTCPFIQGHQNCLKNGRPDLRFLDWRWKPHDCDLPLFDAKKFFKLVKGKAWAFIGDSIARNHFQSVLCFLAQVEMPEVLDRDEKDLFVRWYFPTYKFTLAVFWSPFLVQWTEDEYQGYPPGVEKLWVDTADSKWASSVSDYDYVVLSGGQWFMKPSIYYQNDKVVGCHYCPGSNLTQLGFYFGFRSALRVAFDFLVSSKYRGVVFLRTFTPDHFEGGQWDSGGHCVRTSPWHNASLEGVVAEMHRIQLEEFGRTLQLDPGLAARYRVADTIHASLMRPDGHPGPYRSVNPLPIDGTSRVPQDCLHWCLPGPIDTWSAMILEMLKHLS